MLDDWEICCSDDEKYDIKLVENDKWEPLPVQILNMFEELDKNKIFELKWKCPGRRPPTPEKMEVQTNGENLAVECKNEEQDYNFDFEVDRGQLCLRPSGGEVGPRGSAKKNTTTLDAILSNMARHRRMDMMEEDPPDL